MGQFERILLYARKLSANTSEQGTWFENFMKHVFMTSPIYQIVIYAATDLGWSAFRRYSGSLASKSAVKAVSCSLLSFKIS